MVPLEPMNLPVARCCFRKVGCVAEHFLVRGTPTTIQHILLNDELWTRIYTRALQNWELVVLKVKWQERGRT